MPCGEPSTGGIIVTDAPRYGTEMTRFDPVVVEDGEGGQMIRVITDDNQIFYCTISRERALRMIADLALFVAKDIAAHPER